MDTEFFDEIALYEWEFKNKAYRHFDAEDCEKRVSQLIAALEKTSCISHFFYPFIRFKIPKRKRDDNPRFRS